MKNIKERAVMPVGDITAEEKGKLFSEDTGYQSAENRAVYG